MTSTPSIIAPVAVQAQAPPSVRDASPGARRAYETALDFEKLLVGQLSQELVKDSGLGGGGEESGEAGAGGLLSALVPTALTESLTGQGGLGLAGQLMGALDPAATVGPQSISANTGGSMPDLSAPAGTDGQPVAAIGASGGVSA